MDVNRKGPDTMEPKEAERYKRRKPVDRKKNKNGAKGDGEFWAMQALCVPTEKGRHQGKEASSWTLNVRIVDPVYLCTSDG